MIKRLPYRGFQARLLWVTALVLFSNLAIFSSARAHASLLRSDPVDGTSMDAAPKEIRLWFDEPVSLQFSSAQLLDARSQPIPISGLRTDPNNKKMMILILPDLPPGIYSILWKTLSEVDGHFSQGLLVFGVGEGQDLRPLTNVPTKQTTPPSFEVLLRWLNFSLISVVAGAVAFLQWVLNPARLISNLEHSFKSAYMRAQRRVVGLAGLSAWAAFLTGLAMLFWQSQQMAPAIPGSAPIASVAWQVLSRTQWGGAWLARQIIWLILSITLFTLIRHVRQHPQIIAVGSSRVSSSTIGDRDSRHSLRQDWMWIAIWLETLALIIVQASSGHAAGLSPSTMLAVFVDALHLFAACSWVGGLLALAVGLLPELKRESHLLSRHSRAIWQPFSRQAALSVGSLVATGIYSLGRQVASLDGLITTIYGQALLAKSSLVLIMGAAGILNATLLHPRLAAPLARLAKKPIGWTPLPSKWFPRLVLVEFCVGLLVLLTVGVVTASLPPRTLEYKISADEVPTALSQTVGDMMITLSTKPNRPGQNVFTVFASSTRRPPPAEISRVIIRFSPALQGSVRKSMVAEEVEPGRYMLAGNYLSMAGSWQVEAVVRRLGLEDSVARFNWLVAPSGGARPVIVSKYPWESTLTSIAIMMLVLILVCMIAVWLIGKRRELFGEHLANLEIKSTKIMGG